MTQCPVSLPMEGIEAVRAPVGEPTRIATRLAFGAFRLTFLAHWRVSEAKT